MNGQFDWISCANSRYAEGILCCTSAGQILDDSMTQPMTLQKPGRNVVWPITANHRQGHFQEEQPLLVLQACLGRPCMFEHISNFKHTIFKPSCPIKASNFYPLRMNENIMNEVQTMFYPCFFQPFSSTFV